MCFTSLRIKISFIYIYYKKPDKFNNTKFQKYTNETEIKKKWRIRVERGLKIILKFFPL